MQNCDAKAKSLIEAKGPNLLVPWFLMASYLYYVRDISLFSDEFYDKLCGQLLDRWDEIEHPHKYLIDPFALSAGTGYYIKEDEYPGMCKGAANLILEDLHVS